MCGIFGALQKSEPIRRERLDAVMAALHHRGPDGQSCWVSSDGLSALAHTRLSIIGLDNGVQPIANEDGQIQIVVNGEFYDFERQRRELEYRGHRFRTRSDSEVALHMYEEFGAHCDRVDIAV